MGGRKPSYSEMTYVLEYALSAKRIQERVPEVRADVLVDFLVGNTFAGKDMVLAISREPKMP